MNDSNLIPETNNSVICEAVGCYAKATTKVAARLGSEGTIVLFLCDTCKPKFMHSNVGSKTASGVACSIQDDS